MNRLHFSCLSLLSILASCSPGATGPDDSSSGGATGVGGTVVDATGGRGDQTGSGGSSGGSASGGSPATGGGASGGAPGAGGEAASGGETSSTGGQMSDCTPDPSGDFVVEGDVVFDEKTCLRWMKANTSGDPYVEAVAYCDTLDLGGFDDWRIPTAGETVSLFKCDGGSWPPIDDTVFTVSGDGIWTSTESGTIAGDQPKVCGAGQSSGMFYDFGQVGGQNTRCVRGTETLPDRTDCKTVTQICP